MNGNGLYGTYPYLVFTNNTLNNVTQIDGTSYGFYGTRGINITSSTSASIQYNILSNIAYHGISFTGNDVLVKYNFINNAVNKFIDGGAIYTFGNTFTGRVIENNIIINTEGSVLGTTVSKNTWSTVSAIYMDEPCSNILVRDNVIGNGLSGIKFHEAHDIDVYNNVLYNCSLNSLQFENFNSQPDDPIANIDLDSNKIIVKNSTGYAMFFYTTEGDLLSYGTSDYNYYARPIDDDYVFRLYNGSYSEKTLAQWQSFTGQDLNSHKSPV